MQDLNQLLKAILENEVDFLIVGGFAAVVHGSSYVTKDLDITMMLDSENIGKLRFALKDLDPKLRMNPSHKPSFLDEPKDIEGLQNIYLETNAGILDVVTIDESIGSFDELKQRALKVNLFGYDCRILSLDDLIAVKRKLRRPKDLVVIEELLAIKNKK